MELSYWKSTKIFVFCQKSCGSKFWIFFKKFQNFEIFLEFDFLVFWYIFVYFVTYGRKYWADIMFWISWFCSLLLVKWPIFGQLFGLISQKATTGWFSFWLFSTYLCMYFMKLKWFFMVHDLFETEASQPLCLPPPLPTPWLFLSTPNGTFHWLSGRLGPGLGLLINWNSLICV